MEEARLLLMAQVAVALMVVVAVLVETLQTDRAGQELLAKAMQAGTGHQLAAAQVVAVAQVEQDIRSPIQKTEPHLVEMVALAPLLIQLC